jgi:biopolymer transport protein ExbD
MIPMIDIVFQLILFFLVSTTFAMLPGISLQLPESSASEETSATSLSITIINRDEIYINQNQIPFHNLQAELPQFFYSDQNEKSSITLEADQSVSYGLIIEVLDILRTKGYENINLHTLEKL